MPRFIDFHDAVVDRIELRAWDVHAATIALSGVQDARLLGEFEPTGS